MDKQWDPTVQYMEFYPVSQNIEQMKYEKQNGECRDLKKENRDWKKNEGRS